MSISGFAKKAFFVLIFCIGYADRLFRSRYKINVLFGLVWFLFLVSARLCPRPFPFPVLLLFVVFAPLGFGAASPQRPWRAGSAPA